MLVLSVTVIKLAMQQLHLAVTGCKYLVTTNTKAQSFDTTLWDPKKCLPLAARDWEGPRRFCCLITWIKVKPINKKTGQSAVRKVSQN